MGKSVKEGENTVGEIWSTQKCILSRAGDEKSCRNQRGPSRKAKYSLMTDSEQVPWGKGEKNPGRGVK